MLRIIHLDKIMFKIIPLMIHIFANYLHIINCICSKMNNNSWVYLHVKRVVHSTV